MLRRNFFTLVALVLLVCATFSTVAIRPARAAETVYIRADGSIDPPTAPVSTTDNITYTLASSGNMIIIERDNIVFDGAGHGVLPMSLIGRNNVTVANLTDPDYSSSNFTISSSTNCRLTNIAANTENAITISSSTNCTISKVDLENWEGVALTIQESSNNTICDSSFGSPRGLNALISSSSNNSIIGNIMWGATGIRISGSSNNRICWNTISSGDDSCIHFFDSSKNELIGNELKCGMGPLVDLANSSANVFYHNNFAGSSVGSDGLTNMWDGGYPSGGNYWSDYQDADLYKGPLQDESGRDGIIDTPYTISLDIIDHYPLTDPRHPPPWFPLASFETTPLTPLVNETITFDAFDSYDFNGSIVSYAWDFGDGNATTITVPKIDHVYSNAGTYNASLTLTDNEGLNTTLTKAINVGKLNSSISISVSMETIIIGENTTISGAISPKRPEMNVTLWCKLGSEDWITLANLTTDVKSEYLYIWVPSKTGTYALKASWLGDENTFQNESAPIDFECYNISSSISISTSCASTFVGFGVNVSGTLEDMYGDGLTNETVVLYYTFSGITTWTPITSDRTDNLGNYFAIWIPPATGDFIIKAEWAGNSTHSSVSNIVMLSSLPYNNQYVFSVESNSTISVLAFNTTDWALSFSASGPDGTTGYVRVTAAKTLVPNPENIRVYLDGNQTEFSILSAGDSWLLTFEYQHSSHQVQVDFDVGRPDHTPPVADAGPDQSVDEDVQVQFNGSDSTDNIGITSYVWTFVDSTNKTLEGSAPTYTFSNPGIYTVMVNVSDAAGNWATDTMTLTVRDITPPTIGTVSQSPSSNIGIGQLVRVSANIVDVGTGVKNASLIYSYDNGSSWRPSLRMVYNSTSDLYETTILGHIYGTWVTYKITAYDYAGNLMTENNAGQYYSYQVISEFPATFAILLFILTTTLALTTYRKSKAHARKRARWHVLYTRFR